MYMVWIGVVWKAVKMLYQLLRASTGTLSIIYNIFWFFCNVASAGVPWITLILIMVCVGCKFIKLRIPNEKQLSNLLGGSHNLEDLAYWPIANRGAGYDAPENSKAAIKKCAARGYKNVLLDASLTACGEIVIFNRLALERAGINSGVTLQSLTELRKININELHPLGSKFEKENVLTLAELCTLLEETHITIFLHITDNSVRILEILKMYIETNMQFTQRIILISRSPYAIYQLRKLHPNLICGLWIEKSFSFTLLKASTLITSIYGAIFRNIIAPVIGISIVFLSKDEFNLHIAELWRNVGVRPIVYTVNSPNEKRYFQKTMKTQYLTDSLRSEPHLLMKA